MANYKVTLTQIERTELESILHKGYHTSHQFKNACILLNVDEGEYADKPSVNREICKVLKIGMRTIDRVKKRFVEEGFESVLERKPPQREYLRIADGEIEAKLIALSCSKAPEGFARWSLRMLADKAVELGYVPDISYETVRRVLKKTSLNRGK
jgi:5-deoxy-D-glucuronate isomerase